MGSQPRILILDTSQNLAWESMKEILPGIVALCNQVFGSENCYHVNVDTLSKSDLLELKEKLFLSTHILVTAFNAKVASFMRYTRLTLSVDTPFIFYLHGFSSIGCWPIHHFGVWDLLTSQDTFITTCRRDLECFTKNISNNANIHVIPFPISESSNISHQKHCFAYIGRIAEQKNIHTLLWAYSIYKNQNPKSYLPLYLYGKLDPLGSPNMGLQSHGYDLFLKKLAKKLQIQNDIIFKGFVDREKIIEELGREHVFISPSLHSDENFGMAALRSLSVGASAILSDWGGHPDFYNSFCEQVRLVPVYKTLKGPAISPCDLAKQMSKCSPLPSPISLGNYQISNIATRFKQACYSFPSRGEKLNLLQNTKKLLKQRTGMRTFKSYYDPLAHPFFESYGMTHELPSLSSEKKYSLAPWVSIKDGNVTINDPHRGTEGHSCAKNDGISFGTVNTTCARKINHSDAKYLFERGYLFENG